MAALIGASDKEPVYEEDKLVLYHFRPLVEIENPVMFPPGRARLATTPGRRPVAFRLGREVELVRPALDAVGLLEAGHARRDVVLGDRAERLAAALLAPGGTFYLAEFHPFSDVFADDDLSVAYPYFHDEPLVWDEPGTYADLEAKTTHNRSIEWTHGLGSVVSALMNDEKWVAITALAITIPTPRLGRPSYR